jgi:hypothetical protein
VDGESKFHLEQYPDSKRHSRQLLTSVCESRVTMWSGAKRSITSRIAGSGLSRQCERSAPAGLPRASRWRPLLGRRAKTQLETPIP